MKNWIFAHGDADGIASASLILASFNENAEVFFTHPIGLYDDIKNVVKPGDNIVIVDIAISELHAKHLLELMERLISKGCSITYIDHHPEPLQVKLREYPITIFHELNSSSSELTFRYYEDKLPWDMSRVAIYGAISDYLDETSWVKKTLLDWDKRAVYFEAGVLSQGLEGARRHYEFKRRVVKHLSENKLPSEMSELIVRALMETLMEEEMRTKIKEKAKRFGEIAYVINPGGSIARAATYVRAYMKTPIGIAIEERKETFIMSIRSINAKIDLNLILRKITPLLGGSGGGHSQAAGARISKSRFQDFLNTLHSEIVKVA